MKKRKFGDLESSILEILQSNSRMTVNSVKEALGKGDKYTTVMTVLNRLVDKGLVMRERMGLRYEYWLSTTQKSKKSIFEHLRSKLVNVKTSFLVSYLINEVEDLSQEDLEEIAKLIEKAKNEKNL